MWIAITYRKRGEYSRSIELLENIIAINPEMWYYYHELAVSYYGKGLSHKGTGDISLSHECYRQAEDSYCILFDKMRVYHLADDYGYHYHLGVIYIEWEKYPEAIRELNYSIGEQ